MSAASLRTPQETDLLMKFEIDNISTEYREYYAAKRNNFFATIQAFREIWDYYMRLDAIWMREFADLKAAREPERMFPLLLYINAHAKIRVSIELAFSGCMAEARSILRDAVECVAHAHAMVNDAQLQTTWLCKNDGKVALEAFMDAFVAHKKEGLFRGLDELHEAWGDLSETGSHATVMAIVDRFVQVTTDEHVEFKLNYTGLEPRLWALSLFRMLLTCSTMERLLFSDYESRLKLDDQLMRMRDERHKYQEQLREKLKARYNVQPPGGIYPAPRPTIFRP